MSNDDKETISLPPIKEGDTIRMADGSLGRVVKAPTGGTLSGPMFQPTEDGFMKSIFNRTGGHYNIFAAKQETAIDMLRGWFPKGEANTMNFVLFSTSGVHGCYTTLEQIEADMRKHSAPPTEEESENDDTRVPWDVTFVIVQPRLVGMTYGNADLRSLDDLEFCKKLRASSWAVVSEIGKRDP